MMISKELLSEVLGIPVKGELFVSAGNNVCFDTDSKNSNLVRHNRLTGETSFPAKSINIHELAHKCKEWALDLGYDFVIDHHVNRNHIRVYAQHKEVYHQYSEHRHSPQDDIEACEWILNENIN